MKNTMGLWEYIIEHVVWSLLVFLWFRNLLFRCIPEFTYTESLLGFMILSVIVMAICIAITWNRNRNYWNLIENIILCWGVFVCITYIDLYRTRIVYVGIITAVISLLLSILVFFRRIRRRDKRKLIIKRRAENAAILWKRNSAIASLVIIVPVVVSSLLYGTVLNSKEVEVVKVYGDKDSLEANIKVISDVEPSRWEKLSIEDKLFVAQKIVNCEARYYGLSHEIMVGTDDLSTGTLAYYRDLTHQVVIDLDYLANGYSYDVMASLLHEVYHAYSWDLIKLYQKLDEEERSLLMFYDVSVYMEEFADYEDGDENYYAYYMQLAEIHAREAGETESLDYIKAINQHLGIELEVDMDEFSCLQEYINYISHE